MDWGWPQWVFAGLYVLGLVASALSHGKQKTGKHDVLATMIGTAVSAFILHSGGFW